MKTPLALLSSLLLSGAAVAAQSAAVDQRVVRRTGGGPLTVAFVITERFNFLDVAGPLEVFNAARQPKADSRWEEGTHLFKGFMVSNTRDPIHSLTGVTITPDYTFESSPKPDLIVVGAQTGNPPEMYAWLAKMHAEGVPIMSVCIGAVKLARTGMLDGLVATTHHDYIADYAKDFPKIRWMPDRRYVRSSDLVFTSGGDGLSGIDLALHLVDLQFGRTIALGTAKYLEHHGDEWKQDDRVPARSSGAGGR